MFLGLGTMLIPTGVRGDSRPFEEMESYARTIWHTWFAMMVKPLLTIMCPVYNEERVIPLFWNRIRPVIETLVQRYNVHLLFLDNASTDLTPEQIERVRQSW